MASTVRLHIAFKVLARLEAVMGGHEKNISLRVRMDFRSGSVNGIVISFGDSLTL